MKYIDWDLANAKILAFPYTVESANLDDSLSYFKQLGFTVKCLDISMDDEPYEINQKILRILNAPEMCGSGIDSFNDLYAEIVETSPKNLVVFLNNFSSYAKNNLRKALQVQQLVSYIDNAFEESALYKEETVQSMHIMVI